MNTLSRDLYFGENQHWKRGCAGSRRERRDHQIIKRQNEGQEPA